MTVPVVKGWCPGALRPMMSGDGLVVRIRPRLARMSAASLRAVCDLADLHGNGIIELTNRANIQLRGVSEDSLQPVLEGLDSFGLLDVDPTLEGRRNILTQPFWVERDETQTLCQSLVARLAELPDLPGKFGFAIDTGPAPMLSDCSADIRIERSTDGRLILRADGCSTGKSVTMDTAIDQLIALSHWFAQNAPEGTKRMATLLAKRDLPAEWRGVAPARPSPLLKPGATPLGQLVALPFGQILASDLADILKTVSAVRLTPFRMILLEGAQAIAHPALITDAGDPLLRVDACPGAPRCSAASIETHTVARQLAPHIQGRLHVSGCSKGCARAAPADFTLVGREGRFDIVRQGTAQATPTQTSLTPQALLTEMT